MIFGSLASWQLTCKLAPDLNSSAAARQVSFPFSGQEPTRRHPGEIDETEDHQTGNRHAGLVTGPGCSQEPEVRRQKSRTMFAIHREADLTQTVGEGVTLIHPVLLLKQRVLAPSPLPFFRKRKSRRGGIPQRYSTTSAYSSTSPPGYPELPLT
jgi:hypothetical protein